MLTRKYSEMKLKAAEPGIEFLDLTEQTTAIPRMEEIGG
jgi:hypothetical protein